MEPAKYVIMLYDTTNNIWKVRVKHVKYSDNKKSSYSSKFDISQVMIFDNKEKAQTALYFIKSRTKTATDESQFRIAGVDDASEYFKNNHLLDWCIIKIDKNRNINIYSKNHKFENGIDTNEIMFYTNEEEAEKNNLAVGGNLCIKYNDL